jgi:hypothetical protein
MRYKMAEKELQSILKGLLECIKELDTRLRTEEMKSEVLYKRLDALYSMTGHSITQKELEKEWDGFPKKKKAEKPKQQAMRRIEL